MFNLYLRVVRITCFFALIAAVFIGSSCAPPAPNAPLQSVNSNVSNTASNANASPAPAEPPAPRADLTLPMLDALMSDEEFLTEAKNTVQLTDLEIKQLHDAAQKAVSNLSEDGNDTEVRSTRTASNEARRQIQDVLGSDRGNRFMALIDRRVSEGYVTNAKPNQVPGDTRIVVNAPAYRMDIFENGKLTQSYKIGIGYPEFPLPQGVRSAKSIIFNPTWTPPDEAWVKGKIEPGKKIEAGSKLNPLGPIKIPIGLPSLIHGGKNPARLGTFASHGCVGLTNQQVQDFAMKLSALSGKPLTMGDIKGYEKAKTETKEVKLEKPVPVELRYETIVVENGVLRIYRDVYEKGTNTQENLRAVLDTFGVPLDSIPADTRTNIVAALEQMSLDATGKEADGLTEANNNSNAKNANKGSGRVTSNIKGKKMVEFKLPELAGKGYPAPVGAQM